MTGARQKAFVIFNPKAGKDNQADDVRAALTRHFSPPLWTLEIHETTATDDVAAICRAACEQGASLVIAAGGDGTVVGVANGLVHRPIPLGIVPLGTGNFLARALLIPLKLDEAVELIAGGNAIAGVDALEVGGRCFFINVSVGMSPEAVNKTSAADKKVFGRLAYVIAMVKRARLFRLQRYVVRLDGRTRAIRAAEVVISSTTMLEKPPYLFGPPETLGDGQLEVYVVTARTLNDYMRLTWDLFFRSGRPSAKLSHLTVRKGARIDCARRPSLVQADGELIGRTPVEIHLLQRALNVIVPRLVPKPV